MIKDKMQKESLIKVRIILSELLSRFTKLFIKVLLIFVGLNLSFMILLPKALYGIASITVIFSTFLAGMFLGLFLTYYIFWDEIEFLEDEKDDN